MNRHANHTWDLSLHYHLCQNCGAIIESRENFHYRNGAWTKKVPCNRCSNSFLVKKKQELRFGPLLGEPQPPEWKWPL